MSSWGERYECTAVAESDTQEAPKDDRGSKRAKTQKDGTEKTKN